MPCTVWIYWLSKSGREEEFLTDWVEKFKPKESAYLVAEFMSRGEPRDADFKWKLTDSEATVFANVAIWRRKSDFLAAIDRSMRVTRRKYEAGPRKRLALEVKRARRGKFDYEAIMRQVRAVPS